MAASDKPKPLDDLKEGLGLLFRAAKGAVEHIPPLPTEKLDKVEEVAKDAVKEVGRAFESLGNEIDKVINKAGGVGSHPVTPQQPAATAEAPPQEKKEEAKNFDDGYAPEPANKPGGPRVG